MKELLPIIIPVVIGFIIFVWLWRRGAFLKISGYWGEMWEELRKCTWPNMEELKGQTLVVMVSIILLGAFTVGVDLVVAWIVQAIV
jgi:preprotein translocase SecE subunit